MIIEAAHQASDRTIWPVFTVSLYSTIYSSACIDIKIGLCPSIYTLLHDFNHHTFSRATLRTWAALSNPCVLGIGASDRRNIDKEDDTSAIQRRLA